MLLVVSLNGACVVPLAPAVMTRIGSTFHPCRMILSTLLLIVSGENLSFVYVNCMNWIVKLSSGLSGGGLWYGRPLMHSMFGLNLALHWHLR